jgi:lysophospholipase L1-like esterase
VSLRWLRRLIAGAILDLSTPSGENARMLKPTLAILMLAASTVSAQQAPPAAPATPALPSCPELAQALSSVVRNDVRLRDWPALARYREANRALPKAAAGEARIVFMGDSITDAWQQPRFGRLFQDRPWVDRGISGQTTPQMLVRFRPDVIELSPRAVVILAGTNDIAGNTGPMTDEQIEGNLASMSELAQAHGIKVILASIMPVSAYHVGANAVPQTTQRPMARIKALNEWIQKYSREHGHVYLDYFSAMVDANGVLREDLSEDDLHPNLRGYELIAPLAEAAIARALR